MGCRLNGDVKWEKKVPRAGLRFVQQLRYRGSASSIYAGALRSKLAGSPHDKNDQPLTSEMDARFKKKIRRNAVHRCGAIYSVDEGRPLEETSDPNTKRGHVWQRANSSAEAANAIGFAMNTALT